MELPKRKSIRLPGYDYSSPGAYFVTVCTHERRCILSEIAVGAAISRPQDAGAAVRLTAYGEIVDLAILAISAVYPRVLVDKYVIMPNHVHLLLSIHCDDSGRILSAPTEDNGDSGRQIAAPTLGTVVGQMKRRASKQAGKPLWQKSFHEHVIRSEEDYRQIWEYIENNPARWAEDRYYPEASSRR